MFTRNHGAKGVEIELDVTSGEYMSDNDTSTESIERKQQEVQWKVRIKSRWEMGKKACFYEMWADRLLVFGIGFRTDFAVGFVAGFDFLRDCSISVSTILLEETNRNIHLKMTHRQCPFRAASSCWREAASARWRMASFSLFSCLALRVLVLVMIELGNLMLSLTLFGSFLDSLLTAGWPLVHQALSDVHGRLVVII